MRRPILFCPECHTPLPAAAAMGPESPLAACRTCGSGLLALGFPALTRGWGGGSAGQLAAEGEAVCFHHAHKQAEAACDACGCFLCALCSIDFNGRTLCPACLAQLQKAEAAAPAAGGATAAHTPRMLRYDRLAMLSIMLSPFVYCLSIVNACFTLYLCVRHWRTPLSVLPRSRWRFVVSGLLALAVIGLWLVIGTVAVTQIVRARSGKGIAEQVLESGRRPHAE